MAFEECPLLASFKLLIIRRLYNIVGFKVDL